MKSQKKSYNTPPLGAGPFIEEFNKRFFTIMDFRNVTDQFYDPAFDDDPVMIKEVRENEPFTVENITGDITVEIIDQETGETINFDHENEIPENQNPTIIDGGDITAEPRSKVYIAGVEVTILNERTQYLNERTFEKSPPISETLILSLKGGVENPILSLRLTLFKRPLRMASW